MKTGRESGASAGKVALPSVLYSIIFINSVVSAFKQRMRAEVAGKDVVAP